MGWVKGLLRGHISNSLVSIDFFHRIFPIEKKHPIPIEVMCFISKEVVYNKSIEVSSMVSHVKKRCGNCKFDVRMFVKNGQMPKMWGWDTSYRLLLMDVCGAEFLDVDMP